MEKLYYNGRIITMEDGDKNNQPQAVLVKDGVIFFKGSLDEAEKRASIRVHRINLDGKCLMPAFIDSHSHIVMNGQMSVCADLSECESIKDIVKTLRRYIRIHKPGKGQAVLGFGYDHNFLKELRHPDKRVLDRASKDIPIMVMHVSGHICCVNSAMIKISGIPLNVPNPEGGLYGRMHDGKEINGYAEETGMIPFQTALRKAMKPDILGMLKNMQKKYIENGITTAQDGAGNISDMQMLLIMSFLNMLKIDVVMYPVMGKEGYRIMKKYGKRYKNYKRHLKIGGYKMILDGSPQAKTAWMTQPYIGGEENYCGYPWMSTEMVEKNIIKAVRERRQLLVHCNGDAAGDQYLSAYEKALKKTGIRDNLRPVMIHCQTARNDQLDRMSHIGMIASVFVGHVWYWGDVHMKNLGKERGNHISPVKDAMERGITVNFHQDTPVTKPDMLHSVWCAVNRESRNGNTIGSDQKIDVYDALKAVTINAAYEYFEEDQKGSIMAGKQADFVILDKSPLEVNCNEIKDIKVMETIKGGKTLYTRESE